MTILNKGMTRYDLYFKITTTSEWRIETKLKAERPGETTGIIQARNDSD